MTSATSAEIDPIVTVGWLLDRRRDGLARTDGSGRRDLVVCDARSYLDGRVGRDAYRTGHIAGARFIDLDTVLAGPAAPVAGRHPLPDPETFAVGLGAEGIGDDTMVVAYDDLGGMIAGRLVWMLRILGRPAALLDGGIDAWVAQGGAIEIGDPAPVEAQRRIVEPWPTDALATADDVVGHIEAGGRVVDSRAGERYRGEVEPIDPRAGHVPGAVNLPFADNLRNGRFRSTDELASRFAEAGVDAGAIVYCGSGVSACHNILAAEHAGLGRPRLYVGSWSGWSSEPGRPVATGVSR